MTGPQTLGVCAGTLGIIAGLSVRIFGNPPVLAEIGLFLAGVNCGVLLALTKEILNDRRSDNNVE